VRQQKSPVGMNLCITSRCNWRCPDCCAGVGRFNEGYDVDWDTLVALGKTIGHLPGGYICGQYAATNIGFNLSGGEPSFHKDFAAIAPKLRSAFSCDRIIITTNGWGFTRTPEAFLAFDEIHTSLYNDQTFPGCPNNNADIAFMHNFLQGKNALHKFFVYQIERHVPRPPPGPGTCFRSSNGYVIYWEGLLYPCCTSQGMVGRIGIPPTPDWREKIMQVDLPCATCCFRNA